MKYNNQENYESDDESETESEDTRTEYEIELEHYYDKFNCLVNDLICDYFGFLSKTGYEKYKWMPYFDDDIKQLYLDNLEKIKDLLNVKCNTQEHFNNILITLEDCICDCYFYTDEKKYNEYVKLAEYRINFMKK